MSEAGGISGTTAQVVLIQRNGTPSTVLSADQLPSGMLVGPIINDVTYHGGWLWISRGPSRWASMGWDVGAIMKFKPSVPNPASTFTTVITNLPSNGDQHGTDQVVFDKEKSTAYFSQGTATNSGVEGTDNGLATKQPDACRRSTISPPCRSFLAAALIPTRRPGQFPPRA